MKESTRLIVVYLLLAGTCMALGLITEESSIMVGIYAIWMIIFSAMACMEWVCSWWKEDVKLQEGEGK